MSVDLNEVAVASPVNALSKDFANELVRQGYAPRSVCAHMRLLADLSDWLLNQQMVAGDLTSRQLDRFLRDRRSAGITRHRTRKALRPILDFLHGLKLAPTFETPVADDPANAVFDRYRRFLAVERSLATVTADRYVDSLRPFLDSRISTDGLALDLGNLSPADVIAFVVTRCPRQNGGSAKLTVTALRSFLGFLHLEGITERPLACVVPSVAHRRLAGLPKGLEPGQVQRLLASCDTSTEVGCRDLAILTLLVRLGLRRGEVATLTLEDIDWRAGVIVVHGKGNCSERIPLPPDVGLRLVEYLQHARPRERPQPDRVRKERCPTSQPQSGPCEHDRGGCRPEGRSWADRCTSPAPYSCNATLACRSLIAGDRPNPASPSRRNNGNLCQGRP